MKNQQTFSFRSVVTVLLALALIAGACAGSDDDETSASPDVSQSDDVPGSEPGQGPQRDTNAGDAEEEFAPEDPPADEGGLFGAEVELERDAEAGLVEESMSDQADDEEAAVEFDGSVGRSAAEPESGGLFSQEYLEEPVPPPGTDRDNRFKNYGIRDFIETRDDPKSTFALDVDTGSYSIGRQWLNSGSLPPVDSVRVEEYVNAFEYGYDDPRDSALGISIDGGPSPFDEDNYLVRIGVQSQRIDDDDRPDASLTFVIDTSGSMEQDGRLELVKAALDELVDELGDNDTVAIVEFDDHPSVVLEPTDVDNEDDILDALDALRPGGSTNVEAGLELGYELANDMFDDNRVNRVILLSDGVANVGLTDPDGLAEMIRRDADRGIQLLTIGVGMGNFNDVLMEQLADQGDGFYAYVDTEDEAERLFEDNLTATLVTMAIDAKIQVEFDSDIVEGYRLIGFENRGVRDSDFRNNDVDAGEIGAGHQVTAIYEIELERGVDVGDRDELGEVRLRWEEPGTGEITEIQADIDLRMIQPDWDETSDSFQLAVVVATFAEVLRDSPYANRIDLDDLEDEADDLADRMRDRDVEDFADLVQLADRYT